MDFDIVRKFVDIVKDDNVNLSPLVLEIDEYLECFVKMWKDFQYILDNITTIPSPPMDLNKIVDQLKVIVKSETKSRGFDTGVQYDWAEMD